MPNVVQRRVALLSDDGRFADSMTPQAVLDAVEYVNQAVEGIDGSLAEMLAKSANLGDVPSPAAARANLGAAAADHTHTQEQVIGLAAALDAKADLVNGVIPTSQIPREAMGDTVVVASQAEMLALTPEQVQPGDLAIRTDGAGSFILKDTDPSALGSWVRLNSPTDAVTSVNGQIGDVTLSAANVGAATPQQVSDAVGAVEITAARYADQAAGSAAAAADSATASATARGDAITARNGAQAAQIAAARYADQAAGSATAAADSATASATARGDAITARNGAQAAQIAAAESASQAGAAATAAQVAQTGAKAARDEAVAARQATEAVGFDIGEVATLAPGSQATAEVTGAAPDFTLNLGVPAGPAGVTSVTASTLAPGSQATADLVGGVLRVGVPKGDPGDALVPGATLTAPNLVAAIPESTFSPNRAPNLSAWTVSGGAAWADPNITISPGGSASCEIPGVIAGRTYQIDVTRSASSGGEMVVALGAASISVPSWGNNRVTVIAAASGTLPLVIGGGTWVATLQAVVCCEVTAVRTPTSTGLSTRQSGSNNAVGYDSQRSLTTGNSNNAVGRGSQYSLTTGNYNNAVGNGSQYSPRGVQGWATTTASRQVSIGHESGQGSATQSDDIVAVGYWAIADGAKAMALGSRASAAHAGSVALGADVTTTSLGQVAVGPRDVEVQDATKGLILRSPDGSRWRATISNAGVPTWTKL